MGSIEFDLEVNAMYIRLKKGKVDRSEPLSDNVIMDVDKKGKALGIEILLPDHVLSSFKSSYRFV